MAKCDAIDGLKDGLIDDPRKCNFDPVEEFPACTRGGRRDLPHGGPGRSGREGV